MLSAITLGCCKSSHRALLSALINAHVCLMLRIYEIINDDDDDDDDDRADLHGHDAGS